MQEQREGIENSGSEQSLKLSLILISTLIAMILLVGAFFFGFVIARILPERTVTSETQAGAPAVSALESLLPGFNPGGTPRELENLFGPFWQAWNLVHKEFVDQPVEDVTLMRGAIRGMMEALGDQHSSYLDPVQFDQSNAHLQGNEYEGIGAWVDISKDYLTIISPMPGSPAEKAGLLPDDKVIAVDGEDMTGIDGALVREKVIGPRGSTVTLTILREGRDPFEVIVERGNIEVPSVEGKMLDNNIAYVGLYTFGDSTTQDLKKSLKSLLVQNPKGLVLDLRNNGGGYLETAVDVASQFFKDGVVMEEVFGDGERKIREAQPGGLATEIPLVVLINQGSASASEIVAGAIQDRGRGQLVGETSYGKGTVQDYVPLIDDQGAVRITIARWLTPNGRQINEVGLEPDLVVELTEEQAAGDQDIQLQKAVDLLLNSLEQLSVGGS